MSKVKLNQSVRTPKGEITTISSLAERGLIKFTHVPDFYGGRKTHDVYFADLIDGSGSWEIGKLAYQSRTNQEIILGAEQS